MSIIMPEKKPSLFNEAAPIVGTVAGGIGGAFVGNPVLGASIGGAAGNAAVGIANKSPTQAVGGVVDGATSAMSRRLGGATASVPDAVTPAAGAGFDMSEQTKALGEGAEHLGQMSKDLQDQYGPPIMSAYKQSLRRDFSGRP